MYESKNEPLLPKSRFALRMLHHLGLAALIVMATMALGVLGHLLLEPLHWHDALLNTSLIVAGIGPYILPTSGAGKLFLAGYGMLVGLVFVGTLGVVLAPLAHRLVHRFHLDDDDG
ncbi:two pore domain potassium channel family protein [Alcaligenaceae bacterium]|nr:two pore domain potassium channel family protein [Alcaligenaceae bacterium]